MGLIALIALMGCTDKEELAVTSADTARPITFTTYMSQPTTRVDSTLVADGQSIEIIHEPVLDVTFKTNADNTDWADGYPKNAANEGNTVSECNYSDGLFVLQKYTIPGIKRLSEITLTVKDYGPSGFTNSKIWLYPNDWDTSTPVAEIVSNVTSVVGFAPHPVTPAGISPLNRAVFVDMFTDPSMCMFRLSGSALDQIKAAATADGTFTLMITDEIITNENAINIKTRRFLSSNPANAEGERSTLLAIYGRSIGVYGYYHDNTTWSDDATPNFMYNQKATNNGNGQPFIYSPLKYWPNEETDKLSFIAYFPYSHSTEDVNALGITPELAKNGTGLPTFRFQVKEDVKKQVDFTVSRLLPNLPYSRDTEEDPGDPFNDLTITDRVHFYFLHATAKIEFRVLVAEEARKDLAYFTLKGISLTNIYDEAQLTPTYDDGTGETSLVWSGYSDEHKTDYACKTTEAYLLLPQTIRGDARLRINYDLAFKSEGTTFTYDGSGNLVPTEEYSYTNRTTTIQLNTLKLHDTETAITEWLPNHHYVYNLIINPHAITFTGQVAPWGQYIWEPMTPIDQ